MSTVGQNIKRTIGEEGANAIAAISALLVAISIFSHANAILSFSEIVRRVVQNFSEYIHIFVSYGLSLIGLEISRATALIVFGTLCLFLIYVRSWIFPRDGFEADRKIKIAPKETLFFLWFNAGIQWFASLCWIGLFIIIFLNPEEGNKVSVWLVIILSVPAVLWMAFIARGVYRQLYVKRTVQVRHHLKATWITTAKAGAITVLLLHPLLSFETIEKSMSSVALCIGCLLPSFLLKQLSVSTFSIQTLDRNLSLVFFALAGLIALSMIAGLAEYAAAFSIEIEK